MGDRKSTNTKINEILEVLSGFKSGNFIQVKTSGDGVLNALIEGINDLGKSLEVKAQAQAQAQAQTQAQTQAQAQAQAQKDVSFIIESLGIGTWKWDLVSNSLEWDRNMYRLYGADPSDFSGAYDAWESSLSSETKAKAVEEINAAVAGGKDFDTTFQVVQRKTGRIQEVRTRAFIIRSSDGRPLKMWGINIDRTREAELELELKQEQAKVVKSSKLASLGEMSAGIAHEINNPLAIISGSVNLLEKFKDNPLKFSSKIVAIQGAIDRISKIVSGLKKFSRSSDGSTFNVHVLSDIVKEALILTEIKSKRNNTTVTSELNSEALIRCDEVEIEQVLINLINNAVDAVKDQAHKWVRIELSEDGQSVLFRITDSGSGIPETVQRKLFEPFFTTKRVGEGTGLGLSISKGILDEHKATIRVVPNVPNTCFEVRFPKVMVVSNVA